METDGIHEDLGLISYEIQWDLMGFMRDYDTKIFSNIIIPKIHKPISPIQGIPVKE